MKTTILLAALLAVGVLTLFVSLIVWAGKSIVADENSPNSPVIENRVVPAFERLAQEREEAEKNKKEAFHTKAAPPKIKIFQTSYKEGTQVTFNHEKHVEVHKLNCIECHHVEKCSKCHFKSESHTMEVAKGKQAFHENCIGCHAETSGPEQCMDCHKQ